MANPLGGFWSRLTPRERTLVLVLVLVAFVMSTVLLLFLRAQALRKTRNAIDAHRMALDKVYTQGAVYSTRLESKKAKEASISTHPVVFTTLLEEARAGLDNISISNEEELPALDLGDGLIKRAYEFDLRSVTLEDLTRFLAAIESKPGRVILTESLTIRSTSASEDRLNVDVTLATWERRADEAEGDGDEDEEETP